LRTYERGLLRTQTDALNEELLPADSNDLDCRMKDGFSCFKSGDVRVNEHPSLVAMHTLWVRQHNRLARELAELNPHWNDEQLFQVSATPSIVKKM
jgi:peroxidase